MQKSPLENKIIISTNLIHPVFKNTVAYIHDNDKKVGSNGFFLNVPMDLKNAAKWSDELGWEFLDKIYCGGYDDRGLGYVIHSNDYALETSIILNEVITYTSGMSILNDIQRGIGPYQFALFAGYANWGPNTLETQINDGKWIVVDFDERFFFVNLDREEWWEMSVELAAKKKTKDLLNIT